MPTSIPTISLPPPDDLITLDPIDRQILEARIRAELLRRKRQNVRAAVNLTPADGWVEDRFWNPQTVIGERDLSRAKRLVLQSDQRRIIRHVFTIDPRTGRFPYRTIVYSAPKKSGKSTIGAALGCYFAAEVEPPNAVYVLANDREQSSGRVFKFMKPTLYALGGEKDGKYGIVLPNGTEVRAITSDPDKEAGGSYGLTIWDELWAYKSERARLLFDEMMPVTTRNISIRLIVTYAGFEDSSDLLLQLYLSVFKSTEELELQSGARPVAGLEDIATTNSKGELIPCCYEVPEIGLFYYNDHEQRMPWQQGEHGEALARETRTLLTDTNVYRLMENRWQMTESRLLEPDDLKASFRDADKVLQAKRMVFAADAGWKHDSSALVGVYEADKRYKTGYAMAWKPEKDKPLDLEETIMADILRLYRAGLIHRRQAQPGEKRMIEDERLTPIEVYYDPTQLHQVAMNLRKKHKLLCAEFQQGVERLRSDSFLVQQYIDRNIDNGPLPELQSHLEAARAENQVNANQELIRIVKGQGEHAKAIDLAVAQSMALWRCSKRKASGGVTGIAQAVTKGW